jgi:hypothetical protein
MKKGEELHPLGYVYFGAKINIYLLSVVTARVKIKRK